MTEIEILKNFASVLLPTWNFTFFCFSQHWVLSRFWGYLCAVYIGSSEGSVWLHIVRGPNLFKNLPEPRLIILIVFSSHTVGRFTKLRPWNGFQGHARGKLILVRWSNGEQDATPVFCRGTKSFPNLDSNNRIKTPNQLIPRQSINQHVSVRHLSDLVQLLMPELHVHFQTLGVDVLHYG